MKIDSNLKPSIGKGGIKSITIFDVEDIQLVQYDKISDTFLELSLKENANKTTIQLSRGTAEYKEIAENNDGMLRVEHILNFTLDGIISKNSSDIRALEEANQDGVAAIVETKQGVCFLVGYSKRLKTESALKFKKSIVSSAIMMHDSPSESWELFSVDGEKAKIIENTTTQI